MYQKRPSLHNDLLAQLGEHNLDRVGVGGSSPSQVIIGKKSRKNAILRPLKEPLPQSIWL